MKSAVYLGQVSHRRTAPAANAFAYSVCLFYLDLAEIPRLFRWPLVFAARGPAWAKFRRADYHGDARVPLDQAVRDRVETETGVRPDGPIRLLTQLAYFGYCFNPVSFYYCFDKTGARPEFVLTEITNTPWKERHVHVLRLAPGKTSTFDFGKEFHVSPFMPMDLAYRWMFSEPGESLVVHMKNLARGEKFFDATLTLKRAPLDAWTVARALVLHPLMTFKTVFLIHWQALKLKLKGVPFYTHPHKGVAP